MIGKHDDDADVMGDEGRHEVRGPQYLDHDLRRRCSSYFMSLVFACKSCRSFASWINGNVSRQLVVPSLRLGH